MRRLALVWTVGFALSLGMLLVAPQASQQGRPTTLRIESSGKRVKDLQWLLGGHRPNVFREIKGTFGFKPNGWFGLRTATAVKAYKWRLGYPERMIRPVAGPFFFALLRGTLKRPAPWVALAAYRVKMAAASQPTKLALTIKLRELNELGVTEHPLGSNWGYRVSQYQSVTGAWRAAWCVSFQQAMFKWSGYGTFANDAAAVYYVVDYAAYRNWLHAKAKIGALVAFVDYDRYGHRIAGTGHMGFVAKVLSSGFVSIEGNASNSVLERYHPFGSRGAVFIYLPHIA